MISAVQPSPELIDLPFDGYLTKPITREEVVESAAELITWEPTQGGVRGLYRLAVKQRVLATQRAEWRLQDRDAIERVQPKLHETSGAFRKNFKTSSPN